MAIVSSTPGGSGLPIGLMPGALPSDHASRHTLNTTAMRFPLGHIHPGRFIAGMSLAPFTASTRRAQRPPCGAGDAPRAAIIPYSFRPRARPLDHVAPYRQVAVDDRRKVGAAATRRIEAELDQLLVHRGSPQHIGD